MASGLRAVLGGTDFLALVATEGPERARLLALIAQLAAQGGGGERPLHLRRPVGQLRPLHWRQARARR